MTCQEVAGRPLALAWNSVHGTFLHKRWWGVSICLCGSMSLFSPRLPRGEELTSDTESGRNQIKTQYLRLTKTSQGWAVQLVLEPAGPARSEEWTQISWVIFPSVTSNCRIYHEEVLSGLHGRTAHCFLLSVSGIVTVTVMVTTILFISPHGHRDNGSNDGHVVDGCERMMLIVLVMKRI